MTGLTPLERFEQLKSFLKDPQKHPHSFITLDDFVWIERIYNPERISDIETIDRMRWPGGKKGRPGGKKPLGEFVFLYEREQSDGKVNDYRQEAIEIMESGMFRNGLLMGNRKTSDVSIKHIEAFILQIAAIANAIKKNM